MIEIVSIINDIVFIILVNFLLSIKFNISSVIPIRDNIDSMIMYDIFIILFIVFVLNSDTE